MENEHKKTALTDKDFYEQACSYFYYHAEQRTTMLNFFIAVFGASVALYGTLLSSFALASVMIAVFMELCTIIFFMIDSRNRFDVKKSENVIRQIERDYGVDKPLDAYPYGVFSNETNIFKYYGISQRKQRKKELCALRVQYKSFMKGLITKEALDKAVRLKSAI